MTKFFIICFNPKYCNVEHVNAMLEKIRDKISDGQYVYVIPHMKEDELPLYIVSSDDKIILV